MSFEDDNTFILMSCMLFCTFRLHTEVLYVEKGDVVAIEG